MAIELDDVVEEARRKARDGFPAEAGILFRRVLARDRDHADALLGFARLLTRPDSDTVRELGPPPLSLLYRLVLLDREVDPRRFVAVADLARELDPAGGAPGLTARFVRGVALHRAGRHGAARKILEELATTCVDPQREPVDWHLVHFHLGRVAEAERDVDAARASYRSVLSLVPTHRAARERLAQLGEDGGRRLGIESASDFVRTEVGFADRVRLVGFRIAAADGGEDPHGVSVSTLWEWGSGSPGGLSARIDLLGAGGRVVESSAVPLAPGPGSRPRMGAGALFARTCELRAFEGLVLRLSVVKDRPAAGEEARLETDAFEPWLWLVGQSIE
jgi:hypothetical protein